LQDSVQNTKVKPTVLQVIVVFRLINNGLEFWCAGINHTRRMLKRLIT